MTIVGVAETSDMPLYVIRCVVLQGSLKPDGTF